MFHQWLPMGQSKWMKVQVVVVADQGGLEDQAVDAEMGPAVPK